MATFPDVDKDGIPNIQSNPTNNELRMVAIHSLSPRALAKNATFLMGISATLCFLAFAVLVGIVMLFVRRFRSS